MWRLLLRRRPVVLIVITPPIVAPLVASCWCLTHRCTLVVDCHTGAFHSWKWRWSGPPPRPSFRQAGGRLVPTQGVHTRGRAPRGAQRLPRPPPPPHRRPPPLSAPT